MMEVTKSRMQRLRELEKTIRSGLEDFYYVGMALKEIKEHELYKEAGFEDWKNYVKQRWEVSYSYAFKLITAADYRHVLPDLPELNRSNPVRWTEFTVRELTRIPDKKQAARVAKKVVADVVKSHKDFEAGKVEKTLRLTGPTMRKYVDKDLGIDRAAKAKQTRADRLKLPDLHEVVRRYTGRIQGMVENFKKVPSEAWKLLDEERPGMREELAEACDNLSHLMRS